jgi:hypothetical protein
MENYSNMYFDETGSQPSKIFSQSNFEFFLARQAPTGVCSANNVFPMQCATNLSTFYVEKFWSTLT